MIERHQFTRYDALTHLECDNEKYLEYEYIESNLSKEACSFGYQLVNGTHYRWISHAERARMAA